MDIAAPKPKSHAADHTAGSAYRPDIDGLRAVAVLSVLLYHVGIGPFSGGFVGVDVFFVISGYLIMSVLAADIRAGRFSVARFYERRIRRIFPALFVTAAFCLLAAALLFPPAGFESFGKTLLAMTLFASNILFCFDNPPPGGYFAAPSEAQLLLHTWSLAVEEQFYIFLPLALMLLRRFRLRATVIALTIASAVSLAYSVWAVFDWPLGAFYLVTSRAWELLFGSLLALTVVPAPRGRLVRETSAAAGLGLIAYAVYGLTPSTPFPGAAALLPCIGTCALIHASSRGSTFVGRALSCRPAVGIGLISYSLYLWHWPILVVLKHLNAGNLGAFAKAAVLVLSFVAAYLSWRFVEQPFRRRRSRLNRRQLFTGATIVGLLAISAGSIALASGGLPQRFGQPTRAIVAANVALESDRTTDDCANFQKDVHTLAEITFCRVGHAEPQKVLFWGDSLVDAMRPLAERLYDGGVFTGRSAIFATSAGCTPSLRLNQPGPGFHCADFSRLALQRAEAGDVDIVFIAFSAWWDGVDGGQCLAVDPACARRLPHREVERLALEDLRTIVGDLTRRGKRVVLSLPAPTYNMPIPQTMINKVVLGPTYGALRSMDLVRPLTRNDHPALRRAFGAIAADTGAVLYDPRASLCPDDRCVYEIGDVSIYTDSLHVATRHMGLFYDGLRDAFRTVER